MTTRVVTDEQLGQLARKQHDLFRRVREGSIPVEAANRGLQALIEGRFDGVEDKLPADHYRVYVDYTRPTLVELQQKFCSVSPEHDGRKWERVASCSSIDEGKSMVEFFHAKIPRKFLGKPIIKIRDALAKHFNPLGYRFAIELEAYSFGSTLPGLQRKNEAVALGSFALNDHGVPRHTCLRLDDVTKVVSLSWIWIGSELGSSDRLLLVRK